MLLGFTVFLVLMGFIAFEVYLVCQDVRFSAVQPNLQRGVCSCVLFNMLLGFTVFLVLMGFIAFEVYLVCQDVRFSAVQPNLQRGVCSCVLFNPTYEEIGITYMKYRRTKIKGGAYFFTVVTHNRSPFLCHPSNAELLRQAFRDTMQRHPMEINAFVLLPDHLHTIWTLPEGDHNFSMRWRLIKSYFSRHCRDGYKGIISKSRRSKQEQAFWQRRFWEHTIRDDQDFAKHVEYIHYNPVKHGLAAAPKDWEYSSFHRYVQAGLYDEMWGAGDEIVFSPEVGNE